MHKTQDTTTTSSPVSNNYEMLSMADALEALRHLTSRGLLCQKCGHQWATLENQYHIHCEGCKIPTQQYNSVKKGSSFEQLLCKRFGEWVSAFVTSGDKGSPADTADNKIG